MTEPINIVLLMLVILFAGGLFCLSQSPEAEEALGRKLRARAEAQKAARRAYRDGYGDSLTAQQFYADKRAGLHVAEEIRTERIQ